MSTSLPNSILSIAHGIRSTTASMQHFFYQPLVSIADSTVSQSYTSTIYRFSISPCILLCILITVSWWFLSAYLTKMALSALSDFRAYLHQLYWCTPLDLDFLSLSARQCCLGHSFQLMLWFVLHQHLMHILKVHLRDPHIFLWALPLPS